MKKILIVFFTCMIPLYVFGYDEWKHLQEDTIEYYPSGVRILIKLPINSIKFSTEVYDCEGFVVIYPLFSSTGKVCPLTIDCSVMNNNRMIRSMDVDSVLWNTFNRDKIGSRCYIKHGLYNRIDRYQDGYEIYFTDVPKDIFQHANQILNSVKTIVKKSGDSPLQRNKRKIINNDSFRFSSPPH